MDRPVTNLISSNGQILYRNNCIITITANKHSHSLTGSFAVLKSAGNHLPTAMLAWAPLTHLRMFAVGQTSANWHPCFFVGAWQCYWDISFQGLLPACALKRGALPSSSIPWYNHMSLCCCVKSPKVTLKNGLMLGSIKCCPCRSCKEPPAWFWQSSRNHKGIWILCGGGIRRDSCHTQSSQKHWSGEVWKDNATVQMCILLGAGYK